MNCSPMLHSVANDMNRWEIFPSLLIGTSTCIYIYALSLATFWQHSLAWEKMHFTWFSRRNGCSPTRHQILPLLKNHVKCIYSGSNWLYLKGNTRDGLSGINCHVVLTHYSSGKIYETISNQQYNY